MEETLAQKILTTTAFLMVCGLAVAVIPNIHNIWKYFQ